MVSEVLASAKQIAIRTIKLDACNFQYTDYYNGFSQNSPYTYHLQIPGDRYKTRYITSFICRDSSDPLFDYPGDNYFGIDKTDGKWRSREGFGRRYSKRGWNLGHYINTFSAVNGQGVYAYSWGLLDGKPEGNYDVHACVKHRNLVLCTSGTVGDVLEKSGVPFIIKMMKSVRFLD